MRNILSDIASDKKKLIGLGLIILIILTVGGLLLVYSKTGKLPSTSIFQKKASVGLKTEYKNPFNKDTQYVNPFDTYKNPFTVAK